MRRPWRTPTRAVMLHHVNEGLHQLEAEAQTVSDEATVPKTLAKQIAARLKKKPTLAWDEVVADIAEDHAELEP